MPRLRCFAGDVPAGNRNAAEVAGRRAESSNRERRDDPMTPNLQERITDALSRIRSRRVGTNVLEAEMVSDIATTTDGKVRLSLFLTADDDATVVREIRQALEQVEGVTNVRVDVKDGSQASAAQPPPARGPQSSASRTLPVMGQDATRSEEH